MCTLVSVRHSSITFFHLSRCPFASSLGEPETKEICNLSRSPSCWACLEGHVRCSFLQNWILLYEIIKGGKPLKFRKWVWCVCILTHSFSHTIVLVFIDEGANIDKLVNQSLCLLAPLSVHYKDLT